MKKKINKKLSTSENPIYTEFTHEHLTTCDFRAGIIYHYFDPLDESERRLLDVYKLKKADMDMDLEMLAKNQFKKEYKSSALPLTSSSFCLVLDIVRGTNPHMDKSTLRAEIISTIEHMDGIIQTVTINSLGKKTFSDLFYIMAILSDSNNESLYWIDRAVATNHPESPSVQKYLQKQISSNILILPESHYAIDLEGYMHPLDDDDVNLDSEYAIKLNKQLINQVVFEFTDSDRSKYTNWKKRQKNLPF